MAQAQGMVDLGADASDWLATYGWPVLLLFMLFVVFLYVWSYLNKNLEKMKAVDSNYMDGDVVVYLGRIAKSAMVITLLFLTAYVLSQIWADFNDMVWSVYLGVFVQLAIIVLVLMFAGLIVKVLRHISKRSRLSKKGSKGLSGSAVEFTSLLLSYVVYVAAAVVVLVVLLTYVQSVNAVEALADFWDANHVRIEALVVFLVAIVFVVRLVNAIFEDYKYRTKKFNPQVIDLFKSLIRNVLYLIAFLVTIFILFKIMDLQDVGLILVVTIVVFICVGIGISYHVSKNIISGLAIMNTDIFSAGDKIKIGRDLVCEVVEKNLVFTKVRTEEGETVDVPNSEIISGRVLNYNRSVAHGITVSFEAHSSVPHAEVERKVRVAVSRMEGLMKEPVPEVFAKDFVGEMIVYEVHAYVMDALKAKRTRSDLILHLREEFQAGESKSFSG